MLRDVTRPTRIRRALIPAALAAALGGAAIAVAGGSSPATASRFQVSSAAQQGDVQPTDEAFVVLGDLVTKYGCIAGYPDATFRVDRAVTRYEFAAILNACLDRITETTASTTTASADRATLARLAERFAPELTVILGRVDALNAKVAKLEATQFSNTNKLGGATTTFAISVPPSVKPSALPANKKKTVRTTTTKGKVKKPRSTAPTSTKPTG